MSVPLTFRRGTESGQASGLAPLVAGILALQLMLDSGVMVAPEAGEVLRDLHGPLAGCQDVQQHGDTPHRDAGRGVDPE